MDTPTNLAAATPRRNTKRIGRRTGVLISVVTASLAAGAILAIGPWGGESPRPAVGRSEPELRAITQDLVNRGLIPRQALIPSAACAVADNQ